MPNHADPRPVVGLLYNPAVPFVIDAVPDLVEYVEVIPDRLWYDFAQAPRAGRRFHRVHGALDTLHRCAEGRLIGGHGIGLSLPSAMPIDQALVDQVAALHEEFGFSWYSEHLSMFLTPHGSVPNAQAGLGLPILFDEETLAIIAAKLAILRRTLNVPLLMENGAQFTPVPDADMVEVEFLHRLHRDANCGTLLDLHNIYVNQRNGGGSIASYVESLDPDCVEEIHLGGGDELNGFYTDSHSRLSPPEVWDAARKYAPRFRNLRALVFEFHESYFERLGIDGIAAELERMHELVATLHRAAAPLEPAHAQ
jgi:uncharacterized protein (UPF0276 family)